ncbi:MAG: isochorismatase family protein [Actinomycetota bacterium]|nr:isochorismatase family protein [Actinomycetota bacterium]
MDYSPTTALIVVDVQNDFADPDGSLYVTGGETTIPFINEQIRMAVEAGATIVYTRDWHPSSTPHFAKDGGIWPVHCVGETWGSEFHPDLVVIGGEVKKGTSGEDGYSGFTVRDPETGDESGTGLESLLRNSGITDVVVLGLATDYCVKETALDAVRLGFSTTLLADGVQSVNLSPGDGTRAIAEMVVAGVAVQ